MRRLTLLFAVLALPALTRAARAQGSFEPFPDSSAARYRFDLARNFFKTPEDADVARIALIDRIRRNESVPARASTARELYVALQLVDSVEREAARFYAYYTLRTNIDRTDAGAQDQMN